MLKLTLFSIVLYCSFYSNVDSLFVLNNHIRKHLSLTSENKVNNTRLLNNKLLFVNIHNNNSLNCKIKDEFSQKYCKPRLLHNQYWDSTKNPYHNKTQFVVSGLNDSKVEFVNCSGSEVLPEPNFLVPYDVIHTCSFDGHESLGDYIQNLTQALDERSQRILLNHKLLSAERGLNNFEATAFRSIKALTYWIGSRILNTAKKARDSFDSQDLENERKECNRLIFKWINYNLDKWHSNSPVDAHTVSLSFPSFKQDCFEEYVEGIWTYFNGRVFQNLLPEFWELTYGWFDILDRKYRKSLTESGEVFTLEDSDYMNFPKFMYPNQLKPLPSALANCVFRSMAKLFCDTYSAFNDLDYINIVTNAFRFVETNSAEEEEVNFTVLQRPYESLVNYDSDKISLFNSRNVYSKEYDLNEQAALFLNTHHLPYIKNNLHLLSIYDGDDESALKIYEASFKKEKEILSRDVWFHEGKLTIPVTQLSKSLLHSDLDEFSNVIGFALNDLLQMRPLQLNFVQNRIVSLCVKFINALRSLEAYSSNYEIEQNTSGINKTVEKLNFPLIQCVLFTMTLHEKCVTNNNLYPLSNDFIRKSQLEGLLDMDRLQSKDTKAYESSVYNKFLGQKEQEPVKFIQEYLDDSVAADDHDALRFLVNYYNFNLFGGRLPIDIQIKFKHADCLSSNDVCSVVSTPTIYINPLFQNNKKLICRLILNECISIFLKWSNKFAHQENKQAVSLNDIMEYNMERRIKNHILSCTEPSLSWPFYLDDLLLSNESTYSRRKMSEMFRESFENQDVVKVMANFIKREDVSDMWKEGKLPTRDFLSSLFSGVYDLSYAILANPASIQVTSRLNLSDLNCLENKFKQICDEYYSLLYGRDNALNTVLYLEALSIVEAAFDELREQCIKNTLIYTNDLVESISNVTNILTNSIQVQCEDSNIKLDKQTHVCTPASNSPDLDLGDGCIGDSEKLTAEEASSLCNLLYVKYNKFLFHDFLPDVEIRFEDFDELSSLRVDLTGFSKPVILINSHVDDINLLNSQMVLQMVYLSYYYFRHVTSEEFRNQFGHDFKSAFNVVHHTRTNFLKSKLIPVNLEKKINSTKDMKTHNKQYVDFIRRTLEYKDNDLVTLRVNDFVYEVLEGRDKFKHDDRLCNHYEGLETLKAFARHYFNLLSNSSNVGKHLTPETVSTCEDSEAASDTDKSPGLDKILDIFSPGMMKNGWITSMMEHVERKLDDKQIGVFLQPSDTDWQSLLTDQQLDLVIAYLSKHPQETFFAILTKSGALSKRQAVDLISKCIHNDPQFTQKNFASALGATHRDSLPATGPAVEIVDDAGAVKSHEQVGVDDVEDCFNEEVSSALEQLPPNEHDTFLLFLHRLLERDFDACRNVLNSHSSPSLLVDRSAQVLRSINSRNIIDPAAFGQIEQFLHN
ncbi:conserved hypothetical protein [Theileria orientalis strain Shintoku]|uniref:Uncharacterized protein n=1 Tax=Theileria orientalis strain Shintoku TaxID=869250 RepID=J4DNY1_THEOR|nr:conserved hypothetical protein [Theileria orientalis strain Shintoku]BAM39749.1 conserved hypothetical protein [Theileria orientalis strain Shintoku]|eukprot:XP_009690050.1 conserved hypothetical protein [Theileria orientalis strain Shintoku]